LELHWRLHSTAGLVELYVDGSKIIEVTGIDTDNYGNAVQIDFGLIYASGVQNSLILYGDCVAISQTYIGLEPAPQDYTLDISVDGGGSTVPSVGEHWYASGDTATVTAIAGSGWGFDHWTLDDSPAGSDNPIEILMNTNHTLTAVFVEVPEYDLTIGVVGNGATDPSGTNTYNEGTLVSVDAIPDPGWALDHWELDEANVGSAYPYTVTMDADHALTAVFVETPYVFEDGFESAGFSAWSGTTTTSGETATVTGTQPHHGVYSASFTSNGGGGTENAYCYLTVDMDEVYVRGYFYLESGLPLVDEGDRFYLLRLAGTSQNLVYAGIRRDGGVDKWMVYARNGANWMDWTYNDTVLPETGRWICVELHWKLDSAAGLVELYVDGSKIIEVTGIDTDNYGNAVRVEFGLIYASGVQNSLTVYGDCAVVSQTYVGPEPE